MSSLIFILLCSFLFIYEYIQIGNRIRAERIKQGYTQKQFSNLAGIPYSTYSNYENNNREPGREALLKIATALNVDVYSLLPWHDHISEEYGNVSPEHPASFPGLETKISELGYGIKYGCDYAECSDDQYWINYPDGEQVFVTLSEIENLNLETDLYLKFRLEELRKKKEK